LEKADIDRMEILAFSFFPFCLDFDPLLIRKFRTDVNHSEEHQLHCVGQERNKRNIPKQKWTKEKVSTSMNYVKLQFQIRHDLGPSEVKFKGVTVK